MNRPLNDTELSLLSKMAERLPAAERTQLLDDMAVARVDSTSEDGAIVTFAMSGYSRPSGGARCPIQVEGTVQDSDGAQVTVAVHVDENGRLFELELIRWADGAPISPDWTTLKLY